MRRPTALVPAALFVMLTIALAAPLRAQEASTDDQVKALLARGVEEYAAERWDEARAIFEQAHRLKPTARTARGIGMAAFNQRKYVDAVNFLGLALASQEQPLTAEQKGQIEDLLRQSLGFVGRFRFVVSRPEAQLEVRGVPTAQDVECVLPIGSHVVRAHAPGFLPVERAIEVSGGEETRLTLNLVPIPKTPAAAAPDTTLDVWGWSVLGGAAAIAGAAVVLNVMSAAEYDDLERRCRDRRCFPEDTDTSKIDRLDHTATALWITSAGAAATAAGLLTTAWLRGRKHGDKVQLRAAGVGLALRVRY
jgi:hypothetical protein